jgi:hypothetical protein
MLCVPGVLHHYFHSSDSQLPLPLGTVVPFSAYFKRNYSRHFRSAQLASDRAEYNATEPAASNNLVRNYEYNSATNSDGHASLFRTHSV